MGDEVVEGHAVEQAQAGECMADGGLADVQAFGRHRRAVMSDQGLEDQQQRAVQLPDLRNVDITHDAISVARRMGPA